MKATFFWLLSLVANCSICFAQTYPQDKSFYYVANTRPPDAYLSLRTDPTRTRGMNIMTMPNGTLLELIERRLIGGGTSASFQLAKRAGRLVVRGIGYGSNAV
jgi:hypothetical protein